MKLPARRVIDWLASEETCLGAAFCTYNFDPAFFEEHVLRGVLKLRFDPDEQAALFHEEARQALQQTPVAVLADASMRRAGRRLPYDLLSVRSRTFHPKLALVLYETHARAIIGSCNLTRAGYDENVELVFARELRYDVPADVVTLREIEHFLADSVGLLPQRETQLSLVRAALARRLTLEADPETVERDHQIVHSFGQPILDRLFALIPADATVTRVGVLAPFFERDDADVGAEDGIASLLPSLMERRRTDGALLDVAASWVDAPLAPEPGAVRPLAAGLGALWAWRWTEQTDQGKRERIDYLVPQALGPGRLSYRNELGENKRWERDDVESAVEQRKMWPVREPTLHLPKAIVEHLRKRFELKLWLHPSTTFDERGKVQRRGLHAKLFLVATKRRGKERTYVLMGSPNASRGAMLRSVEQGGNVELGVVSVVEGVVSLANVVCPLVLVDPDRVQMVEAASAPLEPDPSAWIVDAVHDAAAKDLTIEWADAAPTPLGAWTIRYDGKQIARGDGPPGEPTRIAPFELVPATAELEMSAGGREVTIPIRVADLAQLPTMSGLTQLGLRELLALLGRRVGTERLATVLAQRGSGAVESMLEAIFGVGFGPVDVFKAWWGLAWELEQPLSLPGFRHRLVGPLGPSVVWTRLREEAGKSIGADEAWVYGCELVRALRGARVPDGPDREPKVELLGEICGVIARDLDSMRPASEGRPWVSAVATFYAREVTRD